ncbi:MAG: hypothetical protein AABZ64_10580 [Nitrospinota bacterium]
MDLTEYRNRHRRPITLPSGLKGFVRPPSVLDLADCPALLSSSMRGGREPGEGDSAREWMRLVLRRCFIPERGVMCDKEPGQCLPGELSIHEVASEDAAALLEAVSALGAERAAAAAAAGNGGAPAGGGSFPPGAA